MLDAPSDAPNADIKKYRDDIGDRRLSDVSEDSSLSLWLLTNDL